jgi:hypothetical protein
MNHGDYSVGISFEDHANPMPRSPSLSPRFPAPSHPPQHQSYQQQFQTQNQTHQARSRSPTPPLAINSQLSLQMATSYVHLWLILTDIQNNDPHPVIAKCVRAIFMHMKVEVAKEVFRTSAGNDEQDMTDHDETANPTSTVRGMPGGRGAGGDGPGEKNNIGDIDSFGVYMNPGRHASNTTSNTLLHLNDRPGQEYGQNCISQDPWLVSSIYDWNRLYFLRPDIGYNPYDDLLSDVGKERSLRMLMREEVKSLSNRIVDNFRPIRDDGLHGMFDGDGHDRERESAGGGGGVLGGRMSARESSSSQKARSGSGQEEDGMQASLLPASLTKFESKGRAGWDWIG